jgi:hypothetical protein
MSVNSTKKKYPIIYGGDLKGIKPGLYLGLFHGYKNEKEREKADGWGANGPMIGPLRYIHTTYGYDLKIQFNDEEDSKKYGLKEQDHILVNSNDCIKFENMEYGDWTVFNVTKEDVE